MWDLISLFKSEGMVEMAVLPLKAFSLVIIIDNTRNTHTWSLNTKQLLLKNNICSKAEEINALLDSPTCITILSLQSED